MSGLHDDPEGLREMGVSGGVTPYNRPAGCSAGPNREYETGFAEQYQTRASDPPPSYDEQGQRVPADVAWPASSVIQTASDERRRENQRIRGALGEMPVNIGRHGILAEQQAYLHATVGQCLDQRINALNAEMAEVEKMRRSLPETVLKMTRAQLQELRNL